MPKLEPKTVQKQIEEGIVHPLYWLYGPEPMKARELLKRLRAKVLGAEAGTSQAEWSFEVVDGSEASVSALVDSAQTPSMLGGTKLLVVRDAHALKNAEALAPLLGPPQKLGSEQAPPAVVVCLSKDLDARKKFSKLLIEKAAVVACEDVKDFEREAWVGFLAKRRGRTLPAAESARLASLEPWSMDRVERELEKLELAGEGLESEAVQGGLLPPLSQRFIAAFLSKKKSQALALAGEVASDLDEALPLLGLLSWNVRQLALVRAAADRRPGAPNAQVPAFLQAKMQEWKGLWSARELADLQRRLAQMDHAHKQRPLEPLGLWDVLVAKSL